MLQVDSLPKFSKCSDLGIFEKDQFKPNSDWHIFLLHLDEIYKLAFRAGLQVEKVKFSTNPLTNSHIKTRFLLKLLHRKVVDYLEAASYKFPYFIRNKLMVQMGVRFRKVE